MELGRIGRKQVPMKQLEDSLLYKGLRRCRFLPPTPVSTLFLLTTQVKQDRRKNPKCTEIVDIQAHH